VSDALSAPADIPGPDLAAPDAGFWAAASELTAVLGWARARRAGPYALLGEILLQVGARIPPQIVLPPLGAVADGQTQGAASLNQLIASVGRSGLSKGESHQLAAEVATWPQKIDGPVYLPLGSGEGISATYAAMMKDDQKQWVMVRLAWSAIFAVTEIDRLAALMGRRAATIGGVLRSMWSGEPIGEANASEERRRYVPRHGYRAGVVVHVQPGRAGALLNADEAAAGTPQRVLWLPASDPGIPDTAPPAPAPILWSPHEDITLAAADLDTAGMDQLGSLPLTVMPVCPAARAMIDRAAVARHRGEAGALDGHALLVREKLAAVLAAFLGRFEVTDEDWQLAGHLMAVSDATRAAVARELRQADEERNEARGRSDAKRAKIVREDEEADHIGKAAQRILTVLGRGGAEMSRSDLRRQVASRLRDYLDDAAEQLAKNGDIEISYTSRHGAGHGGDGARYRRLT
jgi:hypothetical protein